LITRLSRLVISVSLALSMVAASALLAADDSEFYFEFKTPDRALLDKASRLVSIDHVTPDLTRAYANSRELAQFEKLGLAYEVLPHPGTLIVPRMAVTKDALADWDVYPTYGDYVAMMYQFQTDYPALCRIVDAGTTVQGRSILFARISDNVAVEEDEPEVMHTSSMHGDETTGYILCLRLIDSLLAAYGTDAYITRLVDSLDIWINPLANPDGTYHSGDHTVYGAHRYNDNGVDLNRNFPDPAAGDHPDGNSWQPETVVMMNLAEDHSFVISANHHGGAEVLNYPWDTWSRLHADNGWYIDVCLSWAQSAQANSPAGYLESYLFPDGITNGYAWYRVTGGRQDYMNYWRGCREITAELSNVKLLPADQLPAHWDYNKQGLLGFLENGLYGVRGVVTDASTGLPVAATIRVLNHDVDHSEVYADPDVGDYHRMLESGSYDLEFVAQGYYPDTVLGVAIVDELSTAVNVSLDPLAGDPSLAFLDYDVYRAQRVAPVSMTISLVNNGDGNATGVAGTLVTSDPYLTITQDFATFPTIPGLGGTAESQADYSFTAAPECPLNHYALFELHTTGAGGYSEIIPLGVVIEPVWENFESGNLLSLPWDIGVIRPWFMSAQNASDGFYSMRSGYILDNQSSRIEVALEIAYAGKIWFDLSVSSEAGYDFLRFYIDDVERGAWSGSVDWTTVVFDVEAGMHEFAWVYSKDGGVAAGQDQAWVDRIVLPALVSHLEITTQSLPAWTVGREYTTPLEAGGKLGPAIWSDSYGDLVGSGLTLSPDGNLSGVPGEISTIEFTARVEDRAGSPAEKILTMTVNAPPEITTESLPGAVQNELYFQHLEAAYGTPPFSWSEMSGNLNETGLSLSTAGFLEGIPTVRGLLPLVIEVSDAAGATAVKALDLNVAGSCCEGIVGDANYDHGYEPTISDISTMIDMLFISGQPIQCYAEADANLSGGTEPTRGDITISDVSVLIDHLFISGIPLPECP